MNSYLIPANTKSGNLIFGMFKAFDLILFASGVTVTVLLMAILPLTSTFVTVIIMLPALIAGFLVVPVPNYHNMLNIISELIEFYSNQRNYKWKGWCVPYEREKKGRTK